MTNDLWIVALNADFFWKLDYAANQLKSPTFRETRVELTSHDIYITNQGPFKLFSPKFTRNWQTAHNIILAPTCQIQTFFFIFL